jgi:hypothetical protein
MNSRKRRAGVSLGLVVAGLVVVFTLAACGGGGSDGATSMTTITPHKPKPATVESADTKRSQAAAAEDAAMANAVPSGKTSAPVDLKYDLTARPAVGQPLEIVLAFMPRVPAESLDVEVVGMPGLTLASGATGRFEKVQSGQTYTHKVLVQADGTGTFYISVIAKVVSQVQTEARTFSVPVIFGTPVAVQKAAPQKDANGEPIESMPATEKK